MNSAAFIHPSAVVDEGAMVGEGTKIWHFTHLMPGACVGSHCIIGQNVFIDSGVQVGDGVKIQNNVSLYKGVLIEENAFLGPSVVFTNVINPRSFIERKTEFKPTLVHRGASIGANATIVCGVHIGQYAFVGAGAVVTKDVKPFSVVYGNPARHRSWVSKSGYPLVFNNKGEAWCEPEGIKYLLKSDTVELA